MENLRIPKYVIFGIAAIVLLFIFVNFKSIEAGERGVMYNTISGEVSEDTMGPGFHAYLFWYDLYVFDTRLTEVKQKMSVLSRNGLDIELELSLRYRTKKDSLKYVFENIGRNREAYYEKIILPELRSVTREVIGKYDEEDIYNHKREVMQKEVETLMVSRLSKHGLFCETVLVRDINLPSEIQTAIKTKLKEQQLALQYEYKLQREEKEKDRKKIEAQGIAEYQRIVNQSLTPNLLKLRGIEVTKEIANSNNSKIVIVGGSDGLPLILNGH